MAATPSRSVPDRLAELRGPVAPRHHDARTIAALTANPGCGRRAVLDAAGVDKRALAERIGFGARFGQSPFAISRGNAFEKLVKSDGGVTLLRLLRDELGLDVAGPDTDAVLDADADAGADSDADPDAWIDLGTGDREERYRRTRELVAAAAREPEAVAALVDHPLLRLDVGGRPAYVEPDLVALRVRGGGVAGGGGAWRWQLAEIKSFAMIDGRADPVKVADAATQAAVYVLAFQTLLADLGLPPGQVATEIVLICPKDFSNTPTAALVDVRRQLAAVRRQLDRLPRIADLVDTLGAGVSFDLSRNADGEPNVDAAQLAKGVGAVEARYAPECVSRCDMAFYCRDEARAAGSTDLLGRAVRDALGGIGTMHEALALSRSASHWDAPYLDPDVTGAPADPLAGELADADRAEAARLLGVARRARQEALREAGNRAGEGAA